MLDSVLASSPCAIAILTVPSQHRPVSAAYLASPPITWLPGQTWLLLCLSRGAKKLDVLYCFAISLAQAAWRHAARYGASFEVAIPCLFKPCGYNQLTCKKSKVLPLPPAFLSLHKFEFFFLMLFEHDGSYNPWSRGAHRYLLASANSPRCRSGHNLGIAGERRSNWPRGRARTGNRSRNRSQGSAKNRLVLDSRHDCWCVMHIYVISTTLESSANVFAQDTGWYTTTKPSWGLPSSSA